MLPRWSSRPLVATILFGFVLATIIELGQLFVFPLTFRSLDILAATLGTMLAASLIRNLDSTSQPELANSRLTIESRLRGLCETIGSWGATPWILLIMIWAVSVIAISWQPFHFEFRSPAAIEQKDGLGASAKPSFGMQRWSWSPFVNYYWLSRYNAFDLVVKRMCFVAPLGVFTAILFSRRSGIGLLVCLFIALTISLIIELGQCYIPERHPGLTDVCIHLFGAWLGYAFTRHTITSVNRAAKL